MSTPALAEAVDRRYAAMTAGDAQALATLLHEHLTYTHSRGNRDTKESYLARVRGGALAYGPIERREEISLLCDSVAIVTGEMETDVTVDGASRRMHNAFLAVWAHEDGRWLLRAYQPTPVPPRTG
jgi:uncharacterized protein (TIGR02246 family)